MDEAENKMKRLKEFCDSVGIGENDEYDHAEHVRQAGQLRFRVCAITEFLAESRPTTLTDPCDILQSMLDANPQGRSAHVSNTIMRKWVKHLRDFLKGHEGGVQMREEVFR